MNNQEKMSAQQKLMCDMSVIFTKYHSKHMSVAVQRGMTHRASQGYAVNRPKLGYSVTEIPGLFKVNRYGRALRETLKKLANGETNIESATFNIAMILWGFSDTKSWSTIRTKKLMADPYYAGWICYKGQLCKGRHEPLITEEEYQIILDIIHDTKCSDNSLKSLEKSILNHYNGSMSRAQK